MEKKICAKCKIEKDKSEFRTRKVSKNGLQSWCKKCSNKGRMDAYWKNPQKNRLSHLKNVERNRKFIRDYLKTHPCIDCSETDIMVLEFDHVRGKKILEVGSMVSYGLSIKKIEEEIKKCDVRCANCHTRRHYKENIGS